MYNNKFFANYTKGDTAIVELIRGTFPLDDTAPRPSIEQIRSKLLEMLHSNTDENDTKDYVPRSVSDQDEGKFSCVFVVSYACAS